LSAFTANKRVQMRWSESVSTFSGH